MSTADDVREWLERGGPLPPDLRPPFAPERLTEGRAWEVIKSLLTAPFTEAVQQERLRLLGGAVRVVLGGRQPSPRGCHLLAGVATLPSANDFLYPEHLQKLDLEGSEAELESARISLLRGDASTLRATSGAAAFVPSEPVLEILAAMNLELDLVAVRWAPAAEGVETRGMDRWAVMTRQEIASGGAEAKTAIQHVKNVSAKAGVPINDERPSLDAKHLWQRADHVDFWCIKERLTRVSKDIADECDAHLRSQAPFGVFLLRWIGRGGDKDVYKRLGLPPRMLARVRQAFREGDWKFFDSVDDELQLADIHQVSMGKCPGQPEALAIAAEDLIASCRRRLRNSIEDRLKPDEKWLAPVLTAEPTCVPEAIRPLVEEQLRSRLDPSSSRPAALTDAQLLECARFARDLDPNQENALESLVQAWVEEVRSQLAVTGSELSRAEARLQQAGNDLMVGGTAAESSGAKALVARRAGEFVREPVAAEVKFDRPQHVGEPYGAEWARRRILSRRGLVALLTLVVLGWMLVTYLPGAPARPPVPSSAWKPPASVYEQVQWTDLPGVGRISSAPVSDDLYRSLCYTTEGAAPGKPAMVTFGEAARWCRAFNAVVQAQRPELFRVDGDLQGVQARLPRAGEVGTVVILGEWQIRPEGAVLSGQEGGPPARLGQRGKFRVVFAAKEQAH